VIALIEYLRSGENKVGFLNKSLANNMLHKWDEVVDGNVEEETVDVEEEKFDVAGGRTMLRKPMRKRGLIDGEQLARDTKARRKT
jgi:hypothetical protein